MWRSQDFPQALRAAGRVSAPAHSSRPGITGDIPAARSTLHDEAYARAVLYGPRARRTGNVLVLGPRSYSFRRCDWETLS